MTSSAGCAPSYDVDPFQIPNCSVDILAVALPTATLSSRAESRAVSHFPRKARAGDAGRDLLFGLARYETVLGRALSSSWMLACGDASYSIYLLHGLIIPNAGLAILPVGQSSSLTSIMLVRLVVSIVVLIGFSLVTYRIVEYPARRMLRRVLTIGQKQPRGELSPTFVSS